MAAEEWYTPTAEPVPVLESPRPRAAAYELRPLTLGEILDRTFSVYRSRFWLFVGIASMSSAVQLVMNALRVVAVHETRPLVKAVSLQALTGVFSMVVGIVTFLAFSVTQAATVFALSEVYLGRATTIQASFQATRGRWLRYFGIAAWQTWSAMCVFLALMIPAGILVTVSGAAGGGVVVGSLLMLLAVVGGLVAGAILYLRNSLAVPASVVEGLQVRAAMRRSKVLSAGSKGRIFMVLLVAGALYIALATMEAPLSFTIVRAAAKGSDALGAQSLVLLISFVGSALLGPVAMIGLSLMYFDQRIRMEAFDVMVLLEEGRAMAEEAGVPLPLDASPYGIAEPALENSAALEAATEAPVPVAEAAPEASQPAPEASQPAPEASQSALTVSDDDKADDAASV